MFVGMRQVTPNNRTSLSPGPSQDLADHIGRLVFDKFTELTSTPATVQYARRKVLAGIVMTTGEDSVRSATVVAVTTGTKCINGEYMSDHGLVVNDCHAEILARRCLRRYFYDQLRRCSSGDDEAIFVPCPRKDGAEFVLRDGIRFHLYVSTSPCGDGRIFSPHEVAQTDEESGDKHPNRMARGQLRTKIESGEGTIPVKSSLGVQTWDGVLQGERLLTMSCSDKIARWNVLGLQGEATSSSAQLDSSDPASPSFEDPAGYPAILVSQVFCPVIPVFYASKFCHNRKNALSHSYAGQPRL